MSSDSDRVPADTLAWAMLITSPLFILFGARLFRSVLAIFGFVASAYFTQLVLLKYGLWGELSSTAASILLLVVALVGAAIVLSLYKVGVFVLGGSSFVLTGNVIFQLIASNQPPTDPQTAEMVRVIVLTILFAVGGIFTLRVWKAVLRFSTSFVGGYFFSAGLSHIGTMFHFWNDDSLCPLHGFFQSPHKFDCHTPECYGLLGVWGALFLFGWYFQSLPQNRVREGSFLQTDPAYDDIDLLGTDSAEQHSEESPLVATTVPASTVTTHSVPATTAAYHSHAHGHSHVARPPSVQTGRIPVL